MGENQPKNISAEIRGWVGLFIPILSLLLGWFLTQKVTDKIHVDNTKLQASADTAEQKRINDAEIVKLVEDATKTSNNNQIKSLDTLVNNLSDNKLKVIIRKRIDLTRPHFTGNPIHLPVPYPYSDSQ